MQADAPSKSRTRWSLRAIWERHRYRTFLVLALCLFTFLGLTRHLGAGRDDVFITLWAGESLAAGHGLVNQNLEPLEVSSSLLHVLLVAAMAKVVPDCVYTLNKVAGFLAIVVLFGVVNRHRAVLFPNRRFRPVAYALTLYALATTPSFVYWTYGGLETPFVGLLVIVCAVCYVRFWCEPTRRVEIVLIVCPVLLLMARPESFYIILFSSVYALFHVAFQKPCIALIRIVVVPAVFFAALSVFRRLTFGTWLPNPVYAKTSGLTDRLDSGFLYLEQFYTSGRFEAFLGVALCLMGAYYAILVVRSCWKRELLQSVPAGPLIFLFGLVATLHLVILFSGGDWMEYYRFLFPVFPLMVILTAACLSELVGVLVAWMERRGFSTGTVWMFGVLFIVVVGPFWAMSPSQYGGVAAHRTLLNDRVEGNATPCSLSEFFTAEGAWDERVKMLNQDYERDATVLLPFLDSEFAKVCRERGRLVIATPQMGLFPYYLRKRYPDLEFEFVDTLGLCNQRVALLDMEGGAFGVKQGMVLSDVMSGRAGALSEYVLAREPDVLYHIFESPSGAAEIEALGYRPALTVYGAKVFVKSDDGQDGSLGR